MARGSDAFQGDAFGLAPARTEDGELVLALPLLSRYADETVALGVVRPADLPLAALGDAQFAALDFACQRSDFPSSCFVFLAGTHRLGLARRRAAAPPRRPRTLLGIRTHFLGRGRGRAAVQARGAQLPSAAPTCSAGISSSACPAAAHGGWMSAE